MKREPKTASELQALAAELSGYNLQRVSVIKVGSDGDFTLMVDGHTADLDGGSPQTRMGTICDQLRLRYRLKD